MSRRREAGSPRTPRQWVLLTAAADPGWLKALTPPCPHGKATTSNWRDTARMWHYSYAQQLRHAGEGNRAHATLVSAAPPLAHAPDMTQPTRARWIPPSFRRIHTFFTQCGRALRHGSFNLRILPPTDSLSEGGMDWIREMYWALSFAETANRGLNALPTM
jgi:hypothetical protein